MKIQQISGLSLRALKAVGLILLRVLRWLGSLGFRFWLFTAGVALVSRGAYLVHPAAGYLLPGLLLIWDATRSVPQQIPTNPYAPRR